MATVLVTLLMVESCIFLLLSNSPSVGILLSLSSALFQGVYVLLKDGCSLLVLLGVLVFAGGVFVMMSFVVFSSRFDYEKPFLSMGGVMGLQLPMIFLLEGSVDASAPKLCFLVGNYLFAFIFILVVLFISLFIISSLSEESHYY